MGVLAGKVALVTGGTSGIGAASVELFAREGARVAFTGRRVAEGEAIAVKIKASGSDALFIPLDVTDTAAIPGAVERVVEAYGRLDIAFNNAGIGMGGPITAAEEQEWDRAIDTNVKSVYFCLKAEAEQMQRQGSGGAILLNGSVLAGIAVPNVSIYSTSKGAINAMARAAAVELGPFGIRVNSVNAGVTRTPMSARLIFKADDGSEASTLAPAGSVPLGRLAEPEDTANAALFLLSDQASFITGHALFVDGGQSVA